MNVRFELQPNVSGDAAVAKQGFGRVDRSPAPAFDPAGEIDAAYDFFERHG